MIIRRQALQSAAMAFEDWRYSGTPKSGFTVALLMQIARREIVRKRPELDGAVRPMEPMPTMPGMYRQEKP